jgi:hypothetical protein
MTLHEAIVDMLEANELEASKHATYEGFDWGYDGFNYIETKRDAVIAFTEALNAHIDARIKEAKA